MGILLENMCCLGWPVSFGNSSISMLVLFDSVEIAKFSHLKKQQYTRGTMVPHKI